MVKSFNHKIYWGNPMTSKELDFKSNSFEVLGYGRVINRDVKFSSVFDWKINQNKFIARGQLNSE